MDLGRGGKPVPRRDTGERGEQNCMGRVEQRSDTLDVPSTYLLEVNLRRGDRSDPWNNTGDKEELCWAERA